MRVITISHPLMSKLIRKCNLATSRLGHQPVKNHGLREAYATPGMRIGTGTRRANTPIPACDEEGIGTTTPHSQLRQFNFGNFVDLSLTNLPHALSERFALPIYAHARPDPLCAKSSLLCMSIPGR